MALRAGAALLGGAVAVHASLSAGALARSLWPGAQPEPPSPSSNFPGAPTGPGVTAATAAVLSLYSKGCAPRDLLAEGVAFEDPAASLRGKDELSVAFRALRLLEPATAHWHLPPAATAAEHGATCAVDLWQIYRLDGRELRLRSRVLVTLDGDGKVCAMRELWNGRPLLDALPFRAARRATGWASCALLAATERAWGDAADAAGGG